MAKSTTIVRDEKPGGKLAESPVRANQLTGLFTRSVDFLRDVRSEMRKVTTPSREEVQTTTTVVIVTVFAFAAFFYVVDAILSRVIQSMLHWLGGVQ